jgi:protein-disulfide isomerase
MAETVPADPGSAPRGYLPLLPVGAALGLSVLSWLGVCFDGCEGAHLYRFFGFPIPPFGVAYFVLCGVVYLARGRFRLSGFLFALLLSGALGSEVILLRVQKHEIGRWCPLCVGIALSVAAACALYAREHWPGIADKLRSEERKPVMKQLAGKTALILVAFLAGIGISASGLKKTDAFAAGLSTKSLAFGDADSSSEVYIVTDWFCSSCRAAEPEILKGARTAMQQAKVVFVDFPIHPETLNYMPYHLSFIVREKEKYLQIREALGALARKTREPLPEEVQSAVSPLGVKYVPLNYADVLAGTQYFSSLIQKFKVPGTPTVIVLDSRTGKTKTLSGSSAITSDNIMKSLSEVSGK